MVIQVAAGLIHREGRYLIARRKPDAHLGGFWEFPGGKREPGETLEACLHRELFEELNVRIAGLRPYEVVRHSYPEKTVELHFFHCVIVAGEAEPMDGTELRWVLPDEFSQFQFPPADEVILEALRRDAGRSVS